jgi:pyruvate/2-oxoglutarate dehydrogenase complex dihydrolipoamide dehydrogenase (E3) component
MSEASGRCLNYACIPAKAILRSAEILGGADPTADVSRRPPTRPPWGDRRAIGRYFQRMIRLDRNGIRVGFGHCVAAIAGVLIPR